MSDKLLTWEDSVQWLKSQTEHRELAKACYFDDPLIEAAQRFVVSEEWKAVFEISKTYMPSKVLDLGAGNGISSYAYASAGFYVTALEPNPSNVVGAGAISKLAQDSNLNIEIIQTFGESLPFADNSFDIVHGRQVLHHAKNLPTLCKEAARVLRPNGLFIATREHVISRQQDIDKFLLAHPLHHLYGGENAFMLKQYKKAIVQAGLNLNYCYGQYQSVINYAPTTYSQYLDSIALKLKKRLGSKLTESICAQPNLVNFISTMYTWRDHTPGRLYSFIATKP